jgi:hypothetical protein
MGIMKNLLKNYVKNWGFDMNIYKELDNTISEFVGYIYDDEGHPMACADPVLFDNIVQECSMHLKDKIPFDYLSKEAQFCLEEWESVVTEYLNNEYRQLKEV